MSNSKQTNNETKKPRPEWLDWLQIIVIAAVLAFVLNNFVIANARVPTGSMITTIMPGDRVIGSRLAYRFEAPKRGDIIIFHAPDEPETLYETRIRGMRGDKVTFRDGQVYLHDSETPLEENYIREPMKPAALQEFQVPEGAYFCMGDNRNGSVDARYWTNHYVYIDKIVAKVLFRYWPGIKALK